MATTTNYGWTTPNDTDLVKDGAAAIRTLGSSIDTTVFANASAAIAKSTITTKGDLIVGTGSGTFVRQGVGANGTVLTANSAQADGVEWAAPAGGGVSTWTLINTGGTALTGAGTVTVSGLSAKQIFVVVTGGARSSSTTGIVLRINGSTSAGDYASLGIRNATPATYNAPSFGVVADHFAGNSYFELGLMGGSNDWIYGSFFIDQADTTQWKRIQNTSGTQANSTGGQIHTAYNGLFKSTSAVTSISIVALAGNLNQGSVFVYGGN